MTRTRICAAIAALLTALIVQATVISPLVLPAAISLPAVLVAAVALREGAGTGIAFGFASGLVTDLSSRHPAGVLALCWMGIGLICGLAADRTSIRRDALLATTICTVASVLSILLMVLLRTNGVTAASSVDALVAVVVGDAVLSLLMVPLTRWFLGLASLQAPQGPIILLAADL